MAAAQIMVFPRDSQAETPDRSMPSREEHIASRQGHDLYSIVDGEGKNGIKKRALNGRARSLTMTADDALRAAGEAGRKSTVAFEAENFPQAIPPPPTQALRGGCQEGRRRDGHLVAIDRAGEKDAPCDRRERGLRRGSVVLVCLCEGAGTSKTAGSQISWRPSRKADFLSSIIIN